MKKRALVIGLGKSGLAAYRYLESLGWEVTGCDRSLEAGKKVAHFLPEETLLPDFPFDSVIVSPGIHPHHPLYQRALSEGVELIGEAELGLRAMKNRVIGITGTNGKSTLTMMTAHILNACEKRALPLGNIGTPFVDALPRLTGEEIIVAELSSFQLETMKTRSLDIAIFFNFSEDHRDRYESQELYYQTKQRIASFLKPSGLYYIHKSVALMGNHWEGLILLDQNECPIQPLLPFRLRPFTDIALAAFALVSPFGVTKSQFFAALETFTPLPHRIEFIKEVRGIRCYNDSKATNVDSAIFGVKALGTNTILIAGGVDDGSDFTRFGQELPPFVKKLILIGEAKERIAKEVGSALEVVFAKDLEEAVEKGLQVGDVGDNLLLSPGCKSFDMFRNYEHRGVVFKGVLA